MLYMFLFAGVCINSIGSYKCRCLTEYTGLRCEVKIDHCLSEPCQNNATCEDRFGGFACDCDQTGFSGPMCAVNVDECEVNSHKCTSGSTCVDSLGSYSCLCAEGFTGN